MKTRIELNQNVVTKYFNSQKEFENELFVYEKNLAFTPTLLKHDKDKLSISINYLNGENCGSIKNPDFVKLADLFISLHSLSKVDGKVMCLKDTNPRNFLVDENENYFMIDFADWAFDFAEFDLIHFLLFWASILGTDNFTSATKIFVNHYIKFLEINKRRWEKMFLDITELFDERRHKLNKPNNSESKITRINRAYLKSGIFE